MSETIYTYREIKISEIKEGYDMHIYNGWRFVTENNGSYISGDGFGMKFESEQTAICRFKKKIKQDIKELQEKTKLLMKRKPN